MNFTEYYLTEMPHGSVKGHDIDFQIEKPLWNKIMATLVSSNKENIDELLKPFYNLKFKEILLKKFKLLSIDEKKSLLAILPQKFKEDMGLEYIVQ